MNERAGWIKSTNASLVERLENRTGAVFHYERVTQMPTHDRNLRRAGFTHVPVLTIDTVCVLQNEDGTYNIGHTIMSPVDTYNRQLGNAIAFEKAVGAKKEPFVNFSGDVGELVLSVLNSPTKRESTLIGRKAYTIEESIEFTSRICKNLGKTKEEV